MRNELESSYRILEEMATPATRSADLATSADPLEELGDQIARRDFPGSRKCWTIVPTRPWVERTAGKSYRRRTSSAAEREACENILTFALRIQAAGVNRRLKQDMVDQVASSNADDLKRSVCSSRKSPTRLSTPSSNILKPNGRCAFMQSNRSSPSRTSLTSSGGDRNPRRPGRIGPDRAGQGPGWFRLRS